ncbi:MAG TPA: hypothetical protein VGY54_15090 [Polyangiaceae bacterium]|nr:hypothetical protein [Polyangiaceae bacterium]
MSRAGLLLSAALLRPTNLLAPGAGLLLALTWAPWWIFPLSIAVYALMVVLSLSDSRFVARATRSATEDTAGAPIEWGRIARELGQGAWARPLVRISTSERNLAGELSRTREGPEGAQSVLASTLAQVRSAAALGVDLARRLRSLDHALEGYAGMNPEASRREAADKQRRAAAATDDDTRRAYLDAASALEESASAAESLRSLRERTAAQLESLAAVLESVAVRSVRLRVQSDSGSEDPAATLGAEIDAARDTLSVLESIDEPATPRRTRE